VSDGDVGFLNALSVLRRDIEQQIDFFRQRSAGFPCKTHAICTGRLRGIHSAENIGTVAAGREGDENIFCADQGFDLAREDAFEAIVVPGGGEDRWVGGQRQSSQARAIGS